MSDSWVWLARIRRAQGRKGEVFTTLLTDFPEKFAERRQLWLLSAAADAAASAPVARPAARPVELLHHWPHKGGMVLHFAGVDSITAAEALRDLVVAIPLAERATLGPDEYYAGDLIGCALLDVSGLDASGLPAVSVAPRLVGTIIDVDRDAGPVALLVVRAADGAGEHLIPLAKAYLRQVDLAGRRVEMALPEGLLALADEGRAGDNSDDDPEDDNPEDDEPAGA